MFTLLQISNLEASYCSHDKRKARPILNPKYLAFITCFAQLYLLKSPTHSKIKSTDDMTITKNKHNSGHIHAEVCRSV